MTADSVKRYIDKHKLNMLFEEVMSKVLKHMPDEPLDMIIEMFQHKLKNKRKFSLSLTGTSIKVKNDKKPETGENESKTTKPRSDNAKLKSGSKEVEQVRPTLLSKPDSKDDSVHESVVMTDTDAISVTNKRALDELFGSSEQPAYEQKATSTKQRVEPKEKQSQSKIKTSSTGKHVDNESPKKTSTNKAIRTKLQDLKIDLDTKKGSADHKHTKEVESSRTAVTSDRLSICTESTNEQSVKSSSRSSGPNSTPGEPPTRERIDTSRSYPETLSARTESSKSDSDTLITGTESSRTQETCSCCSTVTEQRSRRQELVRIPEPHHRISCWLDENEKKRPLRSITKTGKQKPRASLCSHCNMLMEAEDTDDLESLCSVCVTRQPSRFIKEQLDHCQQCRRPRQLTFNDNVSFENPLEAHRYGDNHPDFGDDRLQTAYRDPALTRQSPSYVGGGRTDCHDHTAHVPARVGRTVAQSQRMTRVPGDITGVPGDDEVRRMAESKLKMEREYIDNYYNSVKRHATPPGAPKPYVEGHRAVLDTGDHLEVRNDFRNNLTSDGGYGSLHAQFHDSIGAFGGPDIPGRPMRVSLTPDISMGNPSLYDRNYHLPSRQYLNPDIPSSGFVGSSLPIHHTSGQPASRIKFSVDPLNPSYSDMPLKQQRDWSIPTYK